MRYSSNILRVKLLIIVLLAITIGAKAQHITIETEAPDTVEIGNTFVLKYKVTADKEIKPELKEPKTNKLNIISGPSQSISSSTTITNEGSKQQVSVTYTYHVIAKNNGTITLPTVDITVDGKTHQSEPKTIIVKGNVKNQAATNNNTNKNTSKPPTNNATSNQYDCFARTIISRHKATTSDTLTLTYRIYTTVPVSQIGKTYYPNIKKEFYTRNITPKNTPIKTETYNGRKYYVYEIYKLILQPRGVGTKTIPETTVTLILQTSTGEKDDTFFGETDIVKEQKKTLKLDVATIEVTK